MMTTTGDPPDTDLERRALEGGAAEFGEYLRSVDHQMRGVAWAVLRDSHQVDDALQNAYEKAFRNRAGFDGRSSLNTWLHSICYRSSIDLARHEGRRRHVDLEVVESHGAGGAIDLDCINRLAATAALEKLDPVDRGLLYLTAALGFSFDEVATITSLRRGTVASKVSRAKHRIARESA